MPTPGNPPAYTLYVEPRRNGEVHALAGAVDARLREGHHYDQCRELGQLGPVQIKSVEPGCERYEGALVERGQKLGEIKPPGLHRGDFWERVFG